jgi:geranylgeranyl diphosphate synthase type II
MHDDIMDQAPLRRGKETVHMKWDENKALLSGDLMMIEAFKLIGKVDPARLSTVLTAFIACAAAVCEGQELDMQYEKCSQVNIDEYIHMIHLKTAALLGFSLEIGAILAGQPKETAAILNNLGVSLGIGFQLKDDLLDVYADQNKFGKQIGGDIIANKKTFLLLTALENADPEQAEILHYWMNQNDFDPTEKVNAVKQVFDQIGIEAITTQKINEYFSKGLEQLANVTAAEDKKNNLEMFIHYLINREH